MDVPDAWGDISLLPRLPSMARSTMVPIYGNLYAINRDSSQKWLYKIGSAIYSSPDLGADGTVYVGANDKALYAITAAGKLKWKGEGFLLAFQIFTLALRLDFSMR